MKNANEEIVEVTEMKANLFRSSAAYAKREDTIGIPTNACAMCGKKTGGQKRTKMVHYTTNGTITTEREHPETQGFFTIGSECAKTLPAAFVFPGWDR